MRRFVTNMFIGAQNSIIVGVPDFSETNRFLDFKNIESDFRFSRIRIMNERKNGRVARYKKR